MKETEIRTLVSSPRPIELLLKKCGFSYKGQYTQVDTMYDYPDGRLFRSGQKIRIRVEDKRAELTFKGKFIGNNSVSRRVETNVSLAASDFESMGLFLCAIGYPPLFTITKKRRKFIKGEVQATLDEWPIIGWMLEIEGPETQILKLAEQISTALPFKNYRLAELIQYTCQKAKKSLKQLQSEYEKKHHCQLGNIAVLL